MDYYAGIDVSLESASLCIVDATGRIVREAKVASEREILIGWFHALGLVVKRTVPVVRAAVARQAVYSPALYRLRRLCGDPKGPLFSTIGRGTRQLTRTVLPQANACAMIGRRAAAAGIATKLGNHSFRTTGIAAYLQERRHARKGGGDGEPCLDAHDAALRSPARRGQPR
jgi:hypothetical protein